MMALISSASCALVPSRLTDSTTEPAAEERRELHTSLLLPELGLCQPDPQLEEQPSLEHLIQETASMTATSGWRYLAALQPSTLHRPHTYNTLLWAITEGLGAVWRSRLGSVLAQAGCQ